MTYTTRAFKVALATAALLPAGCASLGLEDPAMMQTKILYAPDYVGDYESCVAPGGDPEYEPLLGAHPPVGCAHVNNLRAMLADKQDMNRPRALSSADTIRRMTVLERYRDGQPTGTSEEAKGTTALIGGGGGGGGQ